LTLTAQELLEGAGITLSDYRPGQHHRTCPRCSAKRSKAHHSLKVLGVKIDADGATWHCNHCGWAGPEKGKGKGNGAGGEFAATYDYPGFQKVRYPKGHEPRFRIRHREGNGWKWGAGDADTSVLYRKEEVDKAIALGRTILVVEGEKDVDRCWSIGIPATCNAHGATEPGKKPKWRAEHSAQLREADIVVIPDHDDAGYAHCDATCRASLGVAKRVRRLVLAGHWSECPTGGDISDWLDAGHSREELDTLINEAPDYVKAESEKNKAESEPHADDADAEIERLAKLTPLEYEQQRKGAAEKLDIRAGFPDRLVRDERGRLGLDDDSKQGHAIAFPEPEPWHEPVNGAELLDEIATTVRSYVVMPDHCRDICALWSMHACLVDRFIVSPRLGIQSPTKQCGKSTLIDVLSRLVPRPLPSQNVTPAAIFRVVEAHQPTLLIDEADTFLYDNDDLRGILNGNRKGSTVLRTVGDDHEPRAFSVYTAVAIALIGQLPDTLHDRAVTIDLQRRRASETITSFRPDRADHLDVLARKMARWAKDHADRIAERDPEMRLINRRADNWRGLLAIADEAGGEWPGRARKAAEASHNAEGDDASRLELLLGDIRDAFAKEGEAPVANMFAEKVDVEIASADLVKALVAIEGRPWAEMGKSGKPLTQAKFARMLKPLGISPGNIGEEKARVRGYKLTQFEEAFSRYLPPEGDSKCTGAQNAANTGTSDISKPHSPGNGCADVKCEKPNNDGLLCTCAVSRGGSGQKTASTNGADGVPAMASDGSAEGGIDRLSEAKGGASSPTCAVCGKSDPPLNRVAIDGLDVWLHPGCETAYLAGATDDGSRTPLQGAPAEPPAATNGKGKPDAQGNPTDDPEQRYDGHLARERQLDRPKEVPATQTAQTAAHDLWPDLPPSLDRSRPAQAPLVPETLPVPSATPPRPMLPGDRRREEQRARNAEALRRFEDALKGRVH